MGLGPQGELGGGIVERWRDPDGKDVWSFHTSDGGVCYLYPDPKGAHGGRYLYSVNKETQFILFAHPKTGYMKASVALDNVPPQRWPVINLLDKLQIDLYDIDGDAPDGLTEAPEETEDSVVVEPAPLPTLPAPSYGFALAWQFMTKVGAPPREQVRAAWGDSWEFGISYNNGNLQIVDQGKFDRAMNYLPNGKVFVELRQFSAPRGNFDDSLGIWRRNSRGEIAFDDWGMAELDMDHPDFEATMIRSYEAAARLGFNVYGDWGSLKRRDTIGRAIRAYKAIHPEGLVMFNINMSDPSICPDADCYDLEQPHLEYPTVADWLPRAQRANEYARRPEYNVIRFTHLDRRADDGIFAPIINRSYEDPSRSYRFVQP